MKKTDDKIRFSKEYLSQFQNWKISKETKLLSKEVLENIKSYEIIEKEY